MFFSSNDLKQDWIRVEDVVLNEETSGVDKKKLFYPRQNTQLKWLEQNVSPIRKQIRLDSQKHPSGQCF